MQTKLQEALHNHMPKHWICCEVAEATDACESKCVTYLLYHNVNFILGQATLPNRKRKPHNISFTIALLFRPSTSADTPISQPN